jgi:DNA polymerase V
MLHKNKINTALDFTKAADEWIRKHMSVMGLRVKKELCGVSCIPIEKVHAPRKAICTARSFASMIENLGSLQESVSTFAGSCARKLRQDGTCANIIMVFVHTNRFREDDPQYARNMVVRLPVATNSTLEIVKYANIALEKIFRSGYKYKKAGVIVSGIVPDGQIQTGIFDDVDRDRHEKLMGVMDKMNDTYGRNTVKLAIQGPGRKWKLRQEQLSPAYTSDWNEILVIKAK